MLGRFTGGERRLGFTRILGLGIGLAGVAVLAGPDLIGGSTWPIIEVLLVATCYAIAPLIAARYLADVPTLPMTAACLGVAALVYAAPAAATWPDEIPSTRVLLALAGLAVICTALAFIVFFALIREVGAARALVFTYINPAVALAAGVIISGRTADAVEHRRAGASSRGLDTGHPTSRSTGSGHHHRADPRSPAVSICRISPGVVRV